MREPPEDAPRRHEETEATVDDPVDAAIERWMRERPAPAAPAHFASRVIAHVRSDRWRAERRVDLGFNIAVGTGILLVVIGVAGLFHVSGLAVVGQDAVELFALSLAAAADQVAPSLPAYLGAFLLAAGALGLWWYAENL
jgi:hypothetical protein